MTQAWSFWIQQRRGRLFRMRMSKSVSIVIGAAMFLIVSMQSAHSTDSGTLRILKIATVGDYLALCEPLAKDNVVSEHSLLAASVCDGYIQGVLHGYLGTLALKAEIDVARREGIPVSAVKERMEADSDLHRRLTETVRAEAFICAGRAGDSMAIARAVYEHLANGRESDARAYYAVLDSIKVLYPC